VYSIYYLTNRGKQIYAYCGIEILKLQKCEKISRNLEYGSTENEYEQPTTSVIRKKPPQSSEGW